MKLSCWALELAEFQWPMSFVRSLAARPISRFCRIRRWFHFVPSNPWVAVNWRKPEDIKVHLPNICKKLKIGFDATGAKHVLPGENAIELERWPPSHL